MLRFKPVIGFSDVSPASFDSQVTIVGQEKDGVLLLARDVEDGGKVKTCIDVYDHSVGKCQNIYMHDEAVECINATMTRKKLLGFTLRRSVTCTASAVGRPSHNRPIYESYIVPLGTQYATGTKHFGHSSYYYQRVQFIDEPKSDRVSFLLFLSGRIELHRLSPPRKFFNGGRPTLQQQLQQVLVPSYLWCEWDAQRCLLYFVCPAQAFLEEADGDVSCVLRCYSLADPRHPDFVSFDSVKEVFFQISVPAKPLEVLVHAPNEHHHHELPPPSDGKVPFSLPGEDDDDDDGGAMDEKHYWEDWDSCSPGLATTCGLRTPDADDSTSTPQQQPGRSTATLTPTTTTTTTTTTTDSRDNTNSHSDGDKLSPMSPAHNPRSASLDAGLLSAGVAGSASVSAGPSAAATFHRSRMSLSQPSSPSLAQHRDRPALSPCASSAATSRRTSISSDPTLGPIIWSGHVSHAPNAALKLSIVQMREHAVVLAQQRPETLPVGEPLPLQRSIQVSLFILHQQSRLDFSIKVESKIPNPTVFFGTVGDLLAVFVPGSCLQFVDCGPIHEACDSLLLGPGDCPKLPGQVLAEDTPTIVPLKCLLPTAQDKVTDSFGHCFLDLNTGLVHEYSLNRDAFLPLFVSDSGEGTATERRLYLLHMASVHMHDLPLVDKIMMHVCANSPLDITTLLIKEFLLGVPYLSVKEVGTPAAMLRVLPVSGLTPFGSQCDFVGSLQVSSDSSKVYSRLVRRGAGKAVDGGRSSLQTLAATSARSSKPIRSLLRFFGLEEQAHDMYEMGDEGSNSARKASVETLAEHLLSHCPREAKAKCVECAHDVHAYQLEHTSRLYRWMRGILDDDLGVAADEHSEDGQAENSGLMIGGTASQHKRATVFELLQRLYRVLEHLAFLFPKGFHYQFTWLGLHVLPRYVFLQYLSRGVFRLTPDLVDKALNIIGNDEKDHEFKFQLVNRLPNAEDVIRILSAHVENTPYLLEYFMSCLPQHVNVESGLSMYDIEEAFGNGGFGPVEVWLTSLNQQLGGTRSSFGTELAFINSNSLLLTPPELRIQRPHRRSVVASTTDTRGTGSTRWSFSERPVSEV